REAPRSSEAVVACFLAAGRGLAAAHEAGLLHRDFKPDNVFVAHDGRVVVGDFGLAREAECTDPPGDDPLDPSTHPTHSGRIAGTPAYLAPEVMAGFEPTTASDQFSFCVSLWEGLHGQRPFAGRTLFAMHEQIRTRKAVPSTSRVPARLRRVLLRGLDPDPASRHPSMAALLQALDRTPRRIRLLATVSFVLGASALVALGAGGSTMARCSGAAAELAPAWSKARRAALAAAFRPAGQQAAWPAIARA